MEHDQRKAGEGKGEGHSTRSRPHLNPLPQGEEVNPLFFAFDLH